MLRLFVFSLFLSISLAGISQTRYIYLTVSQPDIENCITNIETSFKEGSFNIYPNPSRGIFTLEVVEFTTEHKISLSIFDFSGREILKEDLYTTRGLIKAIDLSANSTGTYVLHIRGEQNAVFKATLIIY